MYILQWPPHSPNPFLGVIEPTSYDCCPFLTFWIAVVLFTFQYIMIYLVAQLLYLVSDLMDEKRSRNRSYSGSGGILFYEKN